MLYYWKCFIIKKLDYLKDYQEYKIIENILKSVFN